MLVYYSAQQITYFKPMPKTNKLGEKHSLTREEKMPRRNDSVNDENIEKETKIDHLINKKNGDEDEKVHLNQMLGEVMRYISDDQIVEIDIEYLLDHTEGLRKWWDEYREKDRKRVEDEIKKSLSDLSLEELEKIREQIKEKA